MLNLNSRGAFTNTRPQACDASVNAAGCARKLKYTPRVGIEPTTSRGYSLLCHDWPHLH